MKTRKRLTREENKDMTRFRLIEAATLAFDRVAALKKFH
jgi:hypothetical protein